MIWPELPYDAWRGTRDTLHAHTQVLGKLATTLHALTGVERPRYGARSACRTAAARVAAPK